MCSLIINKIKINFFFSFRSILYCSHYLLCHYSNLNHRNNNNYNNNWFVCNTSPHFCSRKHKLYSIKAICEPRLFSSHATSHKADWILTTRCLLYLAFLYGHVNSLIKVIRSGFCCLYNITHYFLLWSLTLHFYDLSLYTHANVAVGLIV